MLLIIGFQSRAEWQVTINRMGFFGELGLGVIYDWNASHSMELSLGAYQIGGAYYWQSNVAYRYSRWFVQGEKTRWTPLQIGIFGVRSLDQGRYFTESPDQYPYERYYDETAFRWGLEFGSVLLLIQEKISISYHVRIVDTGLVAVYNNAHKDLQYHVSSGLALRYSF